MAGSDVTGEKALEYVIGHPSLQKEIMTHPGLAEKYVGEHGYTHATVLKALADYGKAHHITEGEAQAAVEQQYVTLNGPRPSCPYGNCNSNLGPHDVVGTTFYMACNCMFAFALFFFVQATIVPKQWKTSVTVAGLVTATAWYNYTYMKQQWVETQVSPTTYRYTDWLITVPLQIAEFYFILKAAGPVSSGLGLRLFTTSVVMILAGWLAEVDVMQKLVGFAVGIGCWLYILYEVMMGEAAGHAARITSAAAKKAFTTLTLIVSVGWSIYPIGFAIAYLMKYDQPAGDLSGLAMGVLNITYNIADFINKGAFGLCVWSAAVSDVSDEKERPLI